MYIDQIYKKHKRIKYAIKCRLLDITCEAYKNGAKFEDIFDATCISKDEILNWNTKGIKKSDLFNEIMAAITELNTKIDKLLLIQQEE